MIRARCDGMRWFAFCHSGHHSLMREWHRRFAPDIPLDFVRWFRDACSQHFEYALSAALPDDRLVEDLGMYDATFSDVDMDILEDYEARYRARIPDDGQTHITTFGQFLRTLWLYAQQQILAV